MKVVVDSTKVFYMGWKYDNPLLDSMLKHVGITPEEGRKMTVPKIAEAIGIKMNAIPKPSVVHCIILNDERVKIMDVMVKRYYKEEYNVDKARQYSMEKAISVLFPKKEAGEGADKGLVEYIMMENGRNKRARAAFWNAYRSRNQKKENNVNKKVPQAVQAYH